MSSHDLLQNIAQLGKKIADAVSQETDSTIEALCQNQQRLIKRYCQLYKQEDNFQQNLRQIMEQVDKLNKLSKNNQSKVVQKLKSLRQNNDIKKAYTDIQGN